MILTYLAVGIALVHLAVVIHLINVKDRSVWGKGINEDISENRNSLKPFQF